MLYINPLLLLLFCFLLLLLLIFFSYVCFSGKNEGKRNVKL